jgi:hypothetical protein
LDDHETITTIVPDAPSIDAVPLYSHETGQLVGIKTVFMELVSQYNYDVSPIHWGIKFRPL